jgi:hypothetical protein
MIDYISYSYGFTEKEGSFQDHLHRQGTHSI